MPPICLRVDVCVVVSCVVSCVCGWHVLSDGEGLWCVFRLVVVVWFVQENLCYVFPNGFVVSC